MAQSRRTIRRQSAVRWAQFVIGSADALPKLRRVALKLIQGPPNSGRAGLIRTRFVAALNRGPLLVVPNADDVFAFERELCEGGAALGGSVMTFGGLFRAVLSAGGVPIQAELSAAQRLRAISIAIEEQRPGLGPLRRSARRPGFSLALERLLEELQAAGLNPNGVAAGTATLEGSAYLSDIAALFSGYEQVRARLGRVDSHGLAQEAIALLGRGEDFWGQRPVFLYGLDDMTPTQLSLIEALARGAEVTIALPYEEGRPVLAARATLLEELRERIGFAAEIVTVPDPANTPSPFLFHLERNFGALEVERLPPNADLTVLRSAGLRGEAESVAVEAARLIAGGVDPDLIAIALRDPARRGPQIATVLESYGVPTALEAELKVAETGVGSALIALLQSEFGPGRAADLLRYLRGPSGVPARRVDWLERAMRRARVQSAATMLELWSGEDCPLPPDLVRIREAASTSPRKLLEEVSSLAARMASRPLQNGKDGPHPGPGEGVELRAAAAISGALSELAELSGPPPRGEELANTIGRTEFRAWSGPVEGRVRIASPYRLRASRFDHVFIGSLQDGEFPRRQASDPFLSEGQRAALGLKARRAADSEENYLFYICLSLARRSLFLSYRDSDEDGGAESRSPLLDDVRNLLEPAPGGALPDRLEESITRGRNLAQVVHPVADSPSEGELARALAAHGKGAEHGALIEVAAVGASTRKRVLARIEAARTAHLASTSPGPLSNRAVINSLAAVSTFGGTTLEEFDLCSYRWFVGHELDPQPLDPAPDPLVQGGLMHATLERLYREQPGGDSLPRPPSLSAWVRRGQELVAEIAAERELGQHPAERAGARRVERLLIRFLVEESKRSTGGYEPWLLEAGFGDGDGNEHPSMEVDGWHLHGMIDRVDRDEGGRAVVLDYKLSSRVTALEKFEEKAKLQLPLYLLAVAEHWGARPVAGLYQPLRATSARRPRGVVFEEAAGALSSYRPYSNDLVDQQGFDQALDKARERATEIVARIRAGDIRRDPGPRRGLRDHDVCPEFCSFASICRRDRSPKSDEDRDGEEQ